MFECENCGEEFEKVEEKTKKGVHSEVSYWVCENCGKQSIINVKDDRFDDMNE